MTKKTFEPVIRTQRDLARAWTTLMGPWGFGGRSVWMMVVVDDRPLSQVTEIVECEEPPRGDELDNFARLLNQLAAELADTDLRFAFLISRSGAAAINDLDRRWAAALYGAARRAGQACETVHLATEGDIRPIPLDELPAPTPV